MCLASIPHMALPAVVRNRKSTLPERGAARLAVNLIHCWCEGTVDPPRQGVYILYIIIFIFICVYMHIHNDCMHTTTASCLCMTVYRMCIGVALMWKMLAQGYECVCDGLLV
jgi:hypothetical protein